MRRHSLPGSVALLAALAAALVLGCQTPSSTTRAVSQAELAVDEATASDAARLAPVELQLAQGKLERAEEAVEAGDHEEARWLAEEALVDAQLAEIKAESEAASGAARDVEGRIDTFQRSLPLEVDEDDDVDLDDRDDDLELQLEDRDGDGIADRVELDD